MPRVFSIVLVSLLMTDVECVFPDTWFGVGCCDRRQETGSELHKTELFLFSYLVDELKPAKVESDAATYRTKHILQNMFKLRRSVAHVVSAVFQVSPCPSTSLVFIFTPHEMQL